MASFIWIRGFSYRTRDSCLVLSQKVLIDKGFLREKNLLFGADRAMLFTIALLRILNVLAIQIQDEI